MDFSGEPRWKLLDCGEEIAIPQGFISALLTREITVEDLAKLAEPRDGFEQGWHGQFRERLSEDYVERNLRFESFGELLSGLSKTLLGIVYCHSDISGYSDIILAKEAASLLGIGAGDYHHTPIISYLSGSGMCMEVASLGVAIARANGFEAKVVGHSHYLRGKDGYHYGVRVYHNGKSKTILPQYHFWKWIKNRHFKVIPDGTESQRLAV